MKREDVVRKDVKEMGIGWEGVKREALIQKALFLLNNAHSHLSEEDLTTDGKCVTTMFLPPNCTALIQPMGQHGIQYVKQNCKKKPIFETRIRRPVYGKMLKELDIKIFFFFVNLEMHYLHQLLHRLGKSYGRIPSPLLARIHRSRVNSEVIAQVTTGPQVSLEALEICCHGMDD